MVFNEEDGMGPELVYNPLRRTGRDGQRHTNSPSAPAAGNSDSATELEQEYGWKRELFTPESSHERKGRIKREITRRNNGLFFAAGWAEIWKQDLRGTLPSFGRKLH